MADPSAKRARLQRFRDMLPYISQSALSAVLAVAEQDGLPPSASRATIARARNDGCQIATPYGLIHQTMTVGESVFEVQNPFAMLYHVARTSHYFADVIATAAHRNPSSVDQPWELILYADEITPGNAMAYFIGRKFWGSYWSVVQFGSAALADEDRHGGNHVFRSVLKHCGALPTSRHVDPLIAFLISDIVCNV